MDVAVGTRSTYAGTDTSGTTTLLTRIPGTVQPQTGDSYARLGAPAGASHAADIAAVPASSATAVWAAGARTITGTVTLAAGQNVATVAGQAPPSNWAAQVISGSGIASVLVTSYASGMSPKEQIVNLVIPGEPGVTLGQMIYMLFLQNNGKFGTPTISTSAPWTKSIPFLRASDGATVFTYVTTYTDSTFGHTVSRGYTTSALPVP